MERMQGRTQLAFFEHNRRLLNMMAHCAVQKARPTVLQIFPGPNRTETYGSPPGRGISRPCESEASQQNAWRAQCPESEKVAPQRPHGPAVRHTARILEKTKATWVTG